MALTTEASQLINREAARICAARVEKADWLDVCDAINDASHDVAAGILRAVKDKDDLNAGRWVRQALHRFFWDDAYADAQEQVEAHLEDERQERKSLLRYMAR